MSDFRVDKLLFEPFLAISEDDETDVIFGWMEDADDLPEGHIYQWEDGFLQFVPYDRGLEKRNKYRNDEYKSIINIKEDITVNIRETK